MPADEPIERESAEIAHYQGVIKIKRSFKTQAAWIELGNMEEGNRVYVSDEFVDKFLQAMPTDLISR